MSSDMPEILAHQLQILNRHACPGCYTPRIVAANSVRMFDRATKRIRRRPKPKTETETEAMAA